MHGSHVREVSTVKFHHPASGVSADAPSTRQCTRGINSEILPGQWRPLTLHTRYEVCVGTGRELVWGGCDGYGTVWASCGFKIWGAGEGVECVCTKHMCKTHMCRKYLCIEDMFSKDRCRKNMCVESICVEKICVEDTRVEYICWHRIIRLADVNSSTKLEPARHQDMWSALHGVYIIHRCKKNELQHWVQGTKQMLKTSIEGMKAGAQHKG